MQENVFLFIMFLITIVVYVFMIVHGLYLKMTFSGQNYRISTVSSEIQAGAGRVSCFRAFEPEYQLSTNNFFSSWFVYHMSVINEIEYLPNSKWGSHVSRRSNPEANKDFRSIFLCHSHTVFFSKVLNTCLMCTTNFHTVCTGPCI